MPSEFQTSDSQLPGSGKQTTRPVIGGGSANLIHWLASIPLFPRFYYRSVDRMLEAAGAGMSLNDHTNGVQFFARTFDGQAGREGVWDQFPALLRINPMVMAIRRDSQDTILTSQPSEQNMAVVSSAVSSLSVLAKNSASPVEMKPLPQLIQRLETPDRKAWRNQVETITSAIAEGSMQKVVLARRIDYQFDAPLDPFQLLENLRRHHTTGAAILVQLSPYRAFFSLSPERLYRREGQQITSDAISSTVTRGDSPRSDEDLRRRLLADGKARREHNFVISGILDSLAKLLSSPATVSETGVMSLDRVHHLRTSIAGILRVDVGDKEITDALHPTPAVGGTPRAQAMEMISALEPFDRGWYAAPIGIIGQNRTELAVAIRSAVILQRTVSVFTGAGIVAGSDPDAEWLETEAKDIIRPLVQGGEI